MKQKTIAQEVSIKGTSLHTGKVVKMTLIPAEINSGIVFCRTDLYGKPEIRPNAKYIGDLVRCTTLQNNECKIHTVEHILSSINGLGIDNIRIELDGEEPPIIDGSAKFFTTLLLEAEIVEQNAESEIIALPEAISVTEGNRSMIALPYDGFKITCTYADNYGNTQHLSIEISPETYIADIAPARTFALYDDIKPLLQCGKIQGASLDSAILIKGKQIISKEPLRFQDELVRHKILDIIGDLSLLGKKINCHIIAVRPGHSINAQLTKKILEEISHTKSNQYNNKPNNNTNVKAAPEDIALDTTKVLNTLPHRYPFVMIDRVTEFISDTELKAIKNVTINEPFFQGHYPGHPVMPGVLQIEAMAQAAGILMLHKHKFERKLAYFMSCDKVKFRKPVTPGDQLEIYIKIIKYRGEKIGVAEGECRVNGQPVSSAELMFALVTDK